MSRWTHAVCAQCFDVQQPGRVPSVLIDPDVEVCCFCGEENISGIYVRSDPAQSPCRGVTGTHAKDNHALDREADHG